MCGHRQAILYCFDETWIQEMTLTVYKSNQEVTKKILQLYIQLLSRGEGEVHLNVRATWRRGGVKIYFKWMLCLVAQQVASLLIKAKVLFFSYIQDWQINWIQQQRFDGDDPWEERRAGNLPNKILHGTKNMTNNVKWK